MTPPPHGVIPYDAGDRGITFLLQNRVEFREASVRPASPEDTRVYGCLGDVGLVGREPNQLCLRDDHLPPPGHAVRASQARPGPGLNRPVGRVFQGIQQTALGEVEPGLQH
jgi:hypothetical protein